MKEQPLCVIVGMGPGISYSTAKLFGEKNFKVAMIARSSQKLKKYGDLLEEEGIKTYSYSGDASNFENLRECMNNIKSELGIPDVLIYNVSVYREAHPSKLDAEIAVDDFKANVGGALIAVQSFIEEMKERGSGTIFLTGGGQGLNPMPILSSLGIGKAAMRNLSFSFHKELKPFNIRVSTVTVDGMVEINTPYDPTIIADKYWELYMYPGVEIPMEVVIE